MANKDRRAVNGKTRKTIRLADLTPLEAREERVRAGAFNAFANFGDIKGESTDKDHKDWVSLSYSRL
jgi:hypothetical protein